MRQQCGLAWQRRGEIAGEKRNRLLNPGRPAAPHATLVHPGAAALVLTRVSIKIKQREAPALMVFQCVGFHVGMPHRRVGRFQRDAVNLADQFE